MLCTTCRRSLQARLPLFRNHLPLSPRRFVATAPSNPNAAPIDPPPPSSSSNAAAPIIRKPAVSGASKPRVKEKARSSVAGGEVLKGLGYTKAKPQILAMEDEEYPAWLWGVLDESASVSGEGVAGMFVLRSVLLEAYFACFPPLFLFGWCGDQTGTDHIGLLHRAFP